MNESAVHGCAVSQQRGGLSVQAKKNEVEGDLVRELVRAAIAEQTRRQAAPLRGIQDKRGGNSEGQQAAEESTAPRG